jgi:tetratricopeptide (TPR) repeat protein
MDYIEQYRKDTEGTGPDEMTVLYMLVLDQLGRHEEAEEEFRGIMERDPDNGDLLFYYYTYCARHGFLDPLRELEKRVAALPQDSSLREFLPFIQAEIRFADGDRKAALDVFESAKTERPDLIDYAGDFLAAGDRTDAAIGRYLSIQENAPDKAQLHLKLSRLYRKKNDLPSARKHAYAAWAQDREDLDARFAYAQFLVEEKQYADAIEVLKFPQYKAVFPENVLDLWSVAMREQMRFDFQNARYTPAFEAAKHLLIYFPYDEEAQDYIRRVEQIRQEEKEQEAARAKKKTASSAAN